MNIKDRDPTRDEICSCFGLEISEWDAFVHFSCNYTEGSGRNLMEYYTECQKDGNFQTF